jgi:DNA gyrase subunit A
MLIRIKVKDIRETGRAVQGVRLIYLEEGDRVVAVAKLAEPDEGEDEPQATLPVAPPAPGGESKVQSPRSKVEEPDAPFLDEE